MIYATAQQEFHVTAEHWKSATAAISCVLKTESGLFQWLGLTPCVFYYLIFSGDLWLSHRPLFWAVYICGG